LVKRLVGKDFFCNHLTNLFGTNDEPERGSETLVGRVSGLTGLVAAALGLGCKHLALLATAGHRSRRP
jgi:hypothetical protein